MDHQIVPDFLGSEIRQALLAYALTNEPRFEATFVGARDAVNKQVRVSRRLTELGPFRSLIEARVSLLVPQAIASLRLTPFLPTGYETELVAHEDGAFYRRHIDLFTDSERASKNGISDRLLSMVYYFYQEPKAFSGGALRLFPMPVPNQLPTLVPVDVLPMQDTAVVFSSWNPHEVLPISCPSGEFRHARFAINCWVLRAQPGAMGDNPPLPTSNYQQLA